MADALVSIALEKLTDVVGQQLSLFAGATHELENLSHKFRSIQAVLDDAESRQASDKSVQLWLSRLRHVAYDIEDLVEDGRISGLGDQEGNQDDGNARKRVRLWNPFSCYKVAPRIREIRERLDQIVVERNSFGFSSSPVGGDDRMLVSSERLTTSLMDESEMFIGRENDKETLISRMVSGSSSNEDRGQVQVVAIAGIGGLGKTTLARQIYRDGRVQGHFNKDLYWVCVSEPFDVRRLIKEIIEEVNRASTSRSGFNAMQDELLQSLRGKRFLLVLDDVWNDDAEKWNMLWLPLNSGAQGSTILVTTRSERVANIMNATYIHELKGLSDDQSWMLFSSRAFAGKRAGDRPKFESIGKEIVNKCKGVPLFIKVIGGAMYSKKTVKDWQNVLDSKLWSSPQVADRTLPALLLTYCNLPPHMKQCFAYCSIFPKDWLFEKVMLIRLWVAQGFIRSEGNREPEDIGEEYFDDLVALSMFQKVVEVYKGKIICKMHELLHDLAQFVVKDEIYSFIGESEQCPIASSNVRHSFLSFTDVTDNKFNKIPIALGRATKLRTLFLNRLHPIDKFDADIFHQARFVRALVFSGDMRPDFSCDMPPVISCDIPRTVNSSNAIVKLPSAIGDLKHLRYLDLSGLDIAELPESVSDLRNLHTLNLSYCRKLDKLPRGIGGMVSLRHLKIESTDKLEYLPNGLSRISGLRSLSKFIVGRGDGGGCGIDELQPLNSLQGCLRMLHLERVASGEDAEKAELWKKQHLCSLFLSMSEGRGGDAETGRIDNVLEGLRPHENLDKLYITGFTGSKLPSWIDGMRYLRELKISSCKELKCLPEGLTRLPSLENLSIDECDKLESLPDEGWQRLVALQELTFEHCEELKCLPEGWTQLPSLENLRIAYCHKLESLPHSLGQLKKLKSLHVVGSKVLRCVPDSLGQLQSLESLLIYGLKKLELLPDSLGQLKALSFLSIGYCEALASLPQELRDLSLLRQLRIFQCSLLSERCKREGGVDWPNISHIPNIYIDQQRIQ